MKRSAAAWLLIGLSLGVPQFCKGEAAGVRAARCRAGWSPSGNAARGAGGGPPGRARGGERRGRYGGGGAP